MSSDKATPRALAKEVAELWAPLASRAVDVRRRWAGGRAGNPDAQPTGGLVDVDLARLHADPLGVVSEIYEELGLKLSPRGEARMRGWLAENGRDKHGKNEYNASWFGLGSREERREVFRRHAGLRRYDQFYCQLFPRSCE